jgi:hypothetical protein
MSFELESNNSFSNANPLAVRDILLGNLSNSRDLDYYQVRIDQASALNVTFTTGRLDASSLWKISWLDASGNSLENGNSLADARVTLASDDAGTDNEISVKGFSSAPSNGTKFSFLRADGGGEDVFTILGADLDGENWTLTLDRVLTKAVSKDTALILNPAYAEVGKTHQLSAYAPSAGTYFFAVQAASWVPDQYSINFQLTSLLEKDSPSNDTFSSAVLAGNSLESNLVYSGNLSSESDVDVYYFTTLAATDFDIDFFSESGVNSNPAWKIQLFDANLPISAAQNVGSSGEIKVLARNAATNSAKTYYVQVSKGDDYSSQEYQLKISGANLLVNHAPKIVVDKYVSNGSNSALENSSVARTFKTNAEVKISDLLMINEPDGQTISQYVLGLGENSSGVIKVGNTIYSGDDAFRIVLNSEAEFLSAKYIAPNINSPAPDIFYFQAVDTSNARDGTNKSSIVSQTFKTNSSAGSIDDIEISSEIVQEGESFTITVNAPQNLQNTLKLYFDVVDGGISSDNPQITILSGGTSGSVTFNVNRGGVSKGFDSGKIHIRAVTEDINYNGLYIEPIALLW